MTYRYANDGRPDRSARPVCHQSTDGVRGVWAPRVVERGPIDGSFSALLAGVHQDRAFAAAVLDSDRLHGAAAGRCPVPRLDVDVQGPQAEGAVVAETALDQWRDEGPALETGERGVLRSTCCPSGQRSAPRVSYRQAWCRVPFVLAVTLGARRFRAVRADGLDSPPEAITSGSCFTLAPRMRRRDPDLDRILRPLSPTPLLARTVQVPPVGVIPRHRLGSAEASPPAQTVTVHFVIGTPSARCWNRNPKSSVRAESFGRHKAGARARQGTRRAPIGR